MQKSTQRTFLTRVAMTMLLYMMSMMVTAQSFVVVDKNGKKIRVAKKSGSKLD